MELRNFVIISLLIFLGCTPSRSLIKSGPANTNKEGTLRQSIAKEANTYVGTKYRYGGLDKRGLDCSGLVYTVFRNHSLPVPRSSGEQIKAGKKITPHSAQVGDLIFFKQNGKINHVAIVTDIRGDDLWVTHSTTSRGVVRENLFDSSYWSSRIEGVRDIIGSGR